MSNFDFLQEKWPMMASQGNLAEKQLPIDSNACLIKLGMLGETLVKYMLALDGIAEPTSDNTHANRIKLLKQNGLLPQDIDSILYSLRINRNKAAHEGYESDETARTLLELAHTLCIWFMQTYGEWTFEATPFILPTQTESPETLSVAMQQLEARNAELQSELSALQAAAFASDANANIDERRKRGASSIHTMQMDERQTRYLIDEQLRRVGWEVDSQMLRYALGTRPQKGKNLAIAEWPTRLNTGSSGAVDYALLAGAKLVGVVEAKRQHTDIPSVIDYQCKEYAQNIKTEHDSYVCGNWGNYKVPFLFATNGRKYLKQFNTKSGIWFLDARRAANVPYALTGWPSPDGLVEMLAQDIDAAEQRLKTESRDFLTDKDGLGLYPFQMKAVEKVEAAILGGQQSILLSMATGTGKTRTALAIIYRLLKTKRFKRVLFLVDRNTLGEQAQDVFKEVKVEDLMTINEICNISELDDTGFEPETKIHVATVQSMVKRILYNESETIPAVTDYDLIVVDEAHRGYILDKEMGDDEVLYRDQVDFVSKYRTVIEYFDAVKVAMTATPALHTTEIFGKPVFNYTYREAVIEGFLVDHDAPHIINTKLKSEGIKYQAGETLAIFDPVTGEITNSAELPDELTFDIDAFNRQVITRSFNETVLAEIAQDLNPEGSGKTLIFAVDDNHADMIVDILKNLYKEYGVDHEAVMKITGSVGGGNKKKVSEAVKRFKNERYPNIVVTVDLLTTGIDVEEITTLVFMRRVKSRILFEQMLGRATRRCPEIVKTHFEIYDPVGVYESLQDVSTMKPVVVSPTASFDDLIDGLTVLSDAVHKRSQIDLIIAKLQRRKRSMNEKELTHFLDLSGGKQPDKFIEDLRAMEVTAAEALIQQRRSLFAMLNEGGANPTRPVIISDKPDVLLLHERGYGYGSKPSDYLEEFGRFVRENMNKIAALGIVCTRPKELTREALKSLKLELDRHHFTELQLNTAWRAAKNEDVTVDIISFIRQQALGLAIVSHEDRIKNAVAKVKKTHSFSKMELDWLDRIEKQLQLESVVDAETFDSGAFKSKGGFPVINKIFRGKLNTVLDEINENLYEDRSIS